METDRSHTFRTDQANIARHTPDLNLRDEGERGRPATTQRRTGTEVKTIHTPGAGILETEIETIYTSALDRSNWTTVVETEIRTTYTSALDLSNWRTVAKASAREGENRKSRITVQESAVPLGLFGQSAN